MSFLNSPFLWLLPLAGIPLLIHWLSRRFPKTFLFSSIEDIRRTVAGRSRLFRWRHLIMLLLRTLALLALVGAFLKPVIASRAPADGKEGRRVLLLVDHSLSMTHADGGTTALSRAKGEARRLLDSLDPADHFNVIRVDASPAAAFVEFSTLRDAAMAFLEDSAPPVGTADFHAANQLAAELARDQKGQLDVYYFSDFQRGNWADVAFSSLPSDARLFFVSAAGEKQRGNRAVSGIRIAEGAVIAGGEIELSIRVANHSPDPWSGKIEAGFDPAHLREREVTLSPWSETDATLVVPVPAGGLQKLTVTLPPDDMPLDDKRHLVVQVRDREEVVLLTGPDAAGGSPAPSLFLRTAVDPYGGEKGVYRPRPLEPGALTPAALSASTRVIGSRLPLLGDDQAGTLATFLRGGGGMILFLDGESDRANLDKLSGLLGEELPLRLTEKLGSENLPGGAMQVASGDFRSRFLRLFENERRQNLALLEFYDLYHAMPTGKGRTLLSYADGTPALTESQIGLGTLLVCNFSVSEASSNLARQRLFPAWIHEMLLRMGDSTNAAMESFVPGDTISGEAWAAEATGRDLIAPPSTKTIVRRDPAGERLRVTFTAPAPGFYRLPGGDGRDLLAFAVNPDPRESDLRSIDPAVLPDRAGGSNSGAAYVGETADYGVLLRGRPVFHWFLLGALGLLLVEAMLFKTLKPRTA
ncbi:BatA and WFA domain-containing protein [Luteolibacter flavescens]|uniref:BatA and WFA domain-containing protein n=1 Tax=Luteolibacter flavescens TaxID=1859460 RepID=A0ABT3FKL6_9BACT|nr:BatA and WFA domain-containing protein [Luteolibacter flavescens]MCW1884126.1 BatA and WFA domain-containing protein [Luteolibacter flavescens]